MHHTDRRPPTANHPARQDSRTLAKLVLKAWHEGYGQNNDEEDNGLFKSVTEEGVGVEAHGDPVWRVAVYDTWTGAEHRRLLVEVSGDVGWPSTRTRA